VQCLPRTCCLNWSPSRDLALLASAFFLPPGYSRHFLLLGLVSSSCNPDPSSLSSLSISLSFIMILPFPLSSPLPPFSPLPPPPPPSLSLSLYSTPASAFRMHKPNTREQGKRVRPQPTSLRKHACTHVRFLKKSHAYLYLYNICKGQLLKEMD